MSNTWIVVADASRARFFTADKPAGPLNEFETLNNPEGRLHEGDLVTDRAGRGNNGAARHGYNNPKDVKASTADRFAAEVCKHLEKGRNNHAFNKLYVMASPTFLGLMRKHQSDALRQLVADEKATDVTIQPPDKIRSHLPEYL